MINAEQERHMVLYQLQSIINPYSKTLETAQYLCSVDRASLYNLVNRTNLVLSVFGNMLIAFLYMFRATMCPSSGKYRTYATPGFIPTCILDSHLYRVTNTRCRVGTVLSPDDGHIVA